ncbi:WD40 repeat domain-containing protein [Micromonospora sp. NPDC003197]
MGPWRLAEAVDGQGGAGAWSVRWLRVGQRPCPHRVLHGEPLSSVAVGRLADGRPVAVLGGRVGLDVYDLMSGEHLARFDAGHGEDCVVAVRNGADGCLVAVSGGADGVLRSWCLDGGFNPGWASMVPGGGAVNAVAVGVLPDVGPVAVSGDADGMVRVWRLSTGELVRAFGADEQETVGALAVGELSPGRPIVVVGSDSAVLAWDLASGVLLGDGYGAHKRPVFGVVVSRLPDGRVVFASVGGDDHISIEDVANGEHVAEQHWVWGYQQWGNGVASMTLPGGGAGWVTAGEDGSLRLWTVTGRPFGPPLLGHLGWVRAVAAGVLSDGRVVVVSVGDDGARVWDLPGDWASGGDGDAAAWQGHGDDRGSGPGHGYRSSAGVIAAVSSVAVLPSAGSSSGAVFSPGLEAVSVVVSAGPDRTVRCWDVVTGAAAGGPLTPHVDLSGRGVSSVRRVAVAGLRQADGREVVVCVAEEYPHGLASILRSYDRVTGELCGAPVVWPGRSTSVLLSACLPDGRPVLVVGGGDEGVQVLAEDGTPLGRPFADARSGYGYVHACAVGEDRPGRVVVATGHSGGRVALWDLADRRLIGQLDVVGGSHVQSMVFGRLADGCRVLVCGADWAVHVWDLAAGRLVCPPFGGHEYGAVALAMVCLPDGARVLVTAGADATLRLWEPATGCCLRTIALHAAATCLASVAPASLVVGTTQGLLRIDMHRV